MLDILRARGVITIGGTIWTFSVIKTTGHWRYDPESDYVTERLGRRGMAGATFEDGKIRFGGEDVIWYEIGTMTPISIVDASQAGDDIITTSRKLDSTPISRRTLSESDCNFLLNHLFGSIGTYATAGREPANLKQSFRGIESNDPRAGMDQSKTEYLSAIHLYGDDTGTETGPVHVPTNVNGTPPKYLANFKGYTSGEYKERGGGWSNRFLFGYQNGLTILVAHVAGGTGGNSGNDSIGTAFMRNGTFRGPRNLAGSLQIGFIGGPGGNSNGYYVHNHISFWRNGLRVNPRLEFCSGGSRF